MNMYIQSYKTSTFFQGSQPISLNRHLNRLSTASPRHKGWATAPQLWALRYYPAALQLNYLYSAFIMRSQTSKNIEALFFMPFHNSQFTNHSS